MVDYSKWKNIEVSDDEDDTHPNIDTPSLFRWRHDARIQRMEEMENERKKLEAEKKLHEMKLKDLCIKGDDVVAAVEIEKEAAKLKEKEMELKKKERLTPWNVDTISKDGWSKTVLNKPKPRPNANMTEEEKEEYYRTFVKQNEKKLKEFGMLAKWDDCRKFLVENPSMCCEETSNYLAVWCLNLEIESKHELMNHVAKQVVAMQYILELAKQLDCDPRACISNFFHRIQKAEQQYKDAFEEELESFKERIRKRAQVKLEEAMKEVEEEEKQERLGPGNLDPVEVFESLPKSMQECFEKRDIALLQKVITELDEDDAKYHMKRCVDSGLWVPDAKAASKEAGPEPEETEKEV